MHRHPHPLPWLPSIASWDGEVRSHTGHRYGCRFSSTQIIPVPRWRKCEFGVFLLKPMFRQVQMPVGMGRLMASQKAFMETLVFSSSLTICGQVPRCLCYGLASIGSNPFLEAIICIMASSGWRAIQYFLVLLQYSGKHSFEEQHTQRWHQTVWSSPLRSGPSK